MRNYGLPASYYSKGDLGIQEGFNKLIANDVSATELEDRITTAQKRVVNADPNVLKTLKAFCDLTTSNKFSKPIVDMERLANDYQ
jgi:hypothetical protein